MVECGNGTTRCNIGGNKLSKGIQGRSLLCYFTEAGGLGLPEAPQWGTGAKLRWGGGAKPTQALVSVKKMCTNINIWYWYTFYFIFFTETSAC